MASREGIPIIRVPVSTGDEDAGAKTNAYLVGETDALLVDPAARTPELDDTIASSEVEHLALTHTHPDHVGGVAEYAEVLDVTVWSLAGREDQFERTTGVTPDRTFRGGTHIGNTTVIETPGHGSDHVSFVAGPDLVSGDVVFDSGSVVIATDGDLRAYLTTLRRLLMRDYEQLLPGHGPTVTSPEATIRRLIRHRLEREDEIRDITTASGPVTLDEVVTAVYGRSIEEVHRFAVLTIRAHLRKLAVEGDISWDGERAIPA